MGSIIVSNAINILASILIGRNVFPRILSVVEQWAEKEISAADKRHGVLNELEIIGLKLTESAARLGVELAVQYLKRAKV